MLTLRSKFVKKAIWKIFIKLKIYNLFCTKKPVRPEEKSSYRLFITFQNPFYFVINFHDKIS